MNNDTVVSRMRIERESCRNADPRYMPALFFQFSVKLFLGSFAQ